MICILPLIYILGLNLAKYKLKGTAIKLQA